MQRLGKYEILSELGRGAFATVFRARDTVLGREVALKVLHAPLLADPGFVRRFENDARAAAQLDHPHIVAIHDLGQAEGRLYIVMPLLRGGNLADRLAREGRLSFSEAVRIVAEIADALEHAHGKGFIHRDVKPTNILFNARGEAVLADFGLVAAAENSIVAQSSAGGVVGTPAYIPPELWEGKPASEQSDVYALACVCYEMLTGEVLFKGDTSPAVMRAHFLPPQFPTAWPAEVPQDLPKILARALSQKPERRYESPGALVAALRALEPKEQVTPAPAVSSVTKMRLPHWVWLAGIGVLALMGLLWVTLGGLEPSGAQTLTPQETLLLVVTHTSTPVTTPEAVIMATSTSKPSPTATATPTALPSSTPTLTPTSTPTPEATPAPTRARATATPRPTATATPAIPPAPVLVAPAQDSELQNPIRFRWHGTLYAGQHYIVSATNTRTGQGLQSPALTVTSWDVNLPGEAYGEWKWVVKFVQGNEVLRNSAEGKFWFNPFPSQPTSEPILTTPTKELPLPNHNIP